METSKIKNYLKQLEQTHEIKILWACETGSRAWGFPSTDSDYDVRLLYVHKLDWYLGLKERNGYLDEMLEEGIIDISGWELKKALQLLRKSNASLLERIQSPIVYQADDHFIAALRELSSNYYSKIATMHHYLSMAKKFVSLLDNAASYKLKRFFYALRAAMVCQWIIEQKTMPPIQFKLIYTTLEIAPALKNRIIELIALKQNVGEAYLHTGEAALITFMKNCIYEAEQVKHTLPAAQGALEPLDLLLKKYIILYDH